jgi:hypothetical protein
LIASYRRSHSARRGEVVTTWCHNVASGVVAALVLAVGLSAQTTPRTESLLDKLLRIAGLTAAPSQMRGPADEVLEGQIWAAQASGGGVKALTTDRGYRSPVFSPDGSIYALKGAAIVRVQPRDGAASNVQNAPGVRKLVGFDPGSTNEIVVLLDRPAGAPLAVLSLRTGAMTPLPYDSNSNDQARVLAQVRAQNRNYGNTALTVRTETKQGLSRPVEWTDVYIQVGTAPPRNVSACDGVNCVQPALSPDRRTVVFIKADE